MATKKKKGVPGSLYSEPTDYIPEDIRKKFGLGEYNEKFNKKTVKKTTKKKGSK